jgi:hypothetical protein
MDLVGCSSCRLKRIANEEPQVISVLGFYIPTHRVHSLAAKHYFTLSNYKVLDMIYAHTCAT